MNSVLSLPPDERPRERCLAKGPDTLSLRECLGLVLGSLSTAERLLSRSGSDLPPSEVERALFLAMEVSPLAHLRGVRGLGLAGQARLLAAFEMARRYALFRHSSTRTPLFPAGASRVAGQALARVSAPLRNEVKEWLGFVPLHRSAGVGELCVVERGVRTHVNIDPAELFARILALRPYGLILFHNHPSGLLRASDDDVDLTQRVGRLAASFGIQLLGHWIVAPGGECWLDSQGRALSAIQKLHDYPRNPEFSAGSAEFAEIK